MWGEGGVRGTHSLHLTCICFMVSTCIGLLCAVALLCYNWAPMTCSHLGSKVKFHIECRTRENEFFVHFCPALHLSSENKMTVCNSSTNESVEITLLPPNTHAIIAKAIVHSWVSAWLSMLHLYYPNQHKKKKKTESAPKTAVEYIQLHRNKIWEVDVFWTILTGSALIMRHLMTG